MPSVRVRKLVDLTSTSFLERLRWFLLERTKVDFLKESLLGSLLKLSQKCYYWNDGGIRLWRHGLFRCLFDQYLVYFMDLFVVQFSKNFMLIWNPWVWFWKEVTGCAKLLFKYFHKQYPICEYQLMASFHDIRFVKGNTQTSKFIAFKLSPDSCTEKEAYTFGMLVCMKPCMKLLKSS